MQQSSLPWWRTDPYDVADAVPPWFDRSLAGPKGLALVRAWPDGRTDPGWGLQGAEGKDGFMPRYMRGEFNERRVLYGFNRGSFAFAFVMRSLRLVCIDIDGKNGGLEHAKRLGMLPPTMAETSKSGDGYHLFYLTDEEWDDEKGYGLLGDRIGIEQGVDIRWAGCVYHHDVQRWNHRIPVALPKHLFELLEQRDQRTAATTARISKVLEGADDMEVLMMQDEILSELAKPIPPGKRNNTLFAIGSQMHQARITDWEDHLERRAAAVGLSQDETEKIIANINKYGTATTGAP
jgi:hypothetical protein